MKKLLLRIGGILIILILGTILTLVISFVRITRVTDGEQIKSYLNPAIALVIIDVQKNLTTENGNWILNLEQTDKMIDNINIIIQKMEEQEFHIIYLQNVFRKNSIINHMTNRAMEEGTEGSEIDDRIKIVGSNIFKKNKMDGFTSHDFEKYLINNEISHLIVVGIDAEDCVDKTIKGAINRNYKITVVSDAIATKTDEKRNIKITDFENMGLEILSTNELIKRY